MSFFAETPAVDCHNRPAHILVVEDNILQRFILAEWLRSQNYIVHEATTTDEATTVLAAPLVTIDLVIADIWLPGMINGIDLTNYIRRVFPQLPMIVVSSMERPSELEDSTPFFKKPYDLNTVSAEINKLLKKQKE